MATLTPGRIFLADSRPVTTTDALQCLKYLSQDENMQKLRLCEDNFLAAQKEVVVSAPYDGYMIIVPVTGALDIICGGDLPLRIDVGEVHMCAKMKGAHCTLVNQYAADWINFLYLFVEVSHVIELQETSKFDFEQIPNQLISLTSDTLPFKISIGMFGGRKEALYHPSPKNRIFAVAIAGAFEMQGRLLHQRDGLALWDAQEIDIEALSKNAVMLMLEF